MEIVSTLASLPGPRRVLLLYQLGLGPDRIPYIAAEQPLPEYGVARKQVQSI